MLSLSFDLFASSPLVKDAMSNSAFRSALVLKSGSSPLSPPMPPPLAVSLKSESRSPVLLKVPVSGALSSADCSPLAVFAEFVFSSSFRFDVGASAEAGLSLPTACFFAAGAKEVSSSSEGLDLFLGDATG